MVVRIRFEGFLSFWRAVLSIPSEVLVRTRWSGRRGCPPWRLTFPEGIGPEDPLVAAILKQPGAKLEPDREAETGEIPCREYIKRVRLRPAASRLPGGTVPEKVLLLCEDESPAHTERLLDELSMLDGWEVRIEWWSNKERRLLVFVLRNRGATELPRLDKRGRCLLWPVYAGCRLFIPVGYTHPLQEIASRPFPADDREPLLLKRKPHDPWEEWIAGEESLPLPQAVDLEPVDPEPVVRPSVVRQGSEKTQRTLSVPLQMTRVIDGEEMDSSEEYVYRIEGVSDSSLPALLLDFMDEAQAGVADVRYHAEPQDPDRPHRGVMYYLFVREPDCRGRGTWAEVFCQPTAFREHGLPILVRHGWRFRPSLERLLASPQERDHLLARLRETMQLDGDHVILVSPGRVPGSPLVERVPAGRPLEDAITTIYDHWNPQVRTAETFEGARSDLQARLEDVHRAIVQEAQGTYQRLQNINARHFEELEELARKADEALGKARKDLGRVEGVVSAVRECRKRAEDAWDDLIQEVRRLHCRMIQKVERWADTRAREAYKELGDAGRVDAKAKDVLAAAKQLLENLKQRTAELKRRRDECKELKTRAVKARATWSRELKSAEDALQGAQEELQGARKEAERRLEEIRAARGRLEQRRGEVQSELRAVEIEMDRVKQDISAQRQKEERLTQERDKLTAMRGELLARISRREELQRAIPGLVEELRKLQGRCERLAPEANRAKELEQEVVRLRGKVQEMEEEGRRLGPIRREIEEIQRMQERLSREIKHLRELRTKVEQGRVSEADIIKGLRDVVGSIVEQGLLGDRVHRSLHKWLQDVSPDTPGWIRRRWRRLFS